MSASDAGIVVALVLAWCLVGGRVERTGVSGPMVFLAAGVLLAQVGVMDVTINASVLEIVIDLALVLALFSDASSADLGILKGHGQWAARMLLIAFPLSIALGAALAMVVLPALGWSTAVLLAASLAATDASLSAGVLSDERVPRQVRLALNLESGLNDGLATPVVLIAIVAAASALGIDHSSHPETSLLAQLAWGALLGVAVGGIGAWLIEHAHRRGWMEPGARRLATLALPIGTLAAAQAGGANKFIAAFVAGLVFGQVKRQVRRPSEGTAELTELPEFASEVLAWITWFLFGACLLVPALDFLDARVVIYAALSLTVIRMVPVALCLIRSGADRPTTLFLGWFGPRGLATVVFGLLIVEDLGNDHPAVHVVTTTLCATILSSVVAHAVTASPLARWLQRSTPTDAPAGPVPSEAAQ